MVKLYRCPHESQHWFVNIGTGWARFPARANGWAERRRVTMFSQQHLNRVPLWLAFNTGLLEGLKRRNLDHAA
jgi:hypothetical protein